MLLLNGERRHCVDVSDRGFQYGDGLFETVEVLNGKPLFFDRHLKRLAEGCRLLSIPCLDPELLEAEARQLSADAEHGVLKLIVTRGSGGRGYRPPSVATPTRLFNLHSYPLYPEDFQLSGIRARLCQRRLAINPDLARIKHLNRLEQVLARAEWQDDYQEGLMLDRQGRVIEGTMSNLFWVADGRLYTPTIKDCGIAGIVRGLLIELAEADGIVVDEVLADVAELERAEEIFVTNSVIGVWPVKQLDGRDLGIGAVTRRLQTLYAAARDAEAKA